MKPSERYRATYAFKPVDHLVRTECFLWRETIARWKEEGLADDYNEKNLFNFDPGGTTDAGLNLGWCEPPFEPPYEWKLIKEEGDTQIIRDWAGRWVRGFKHGRDGFMPQYLKHPVTCTKDWEQEVAPRLDPANPKRYEGLAEKCRRAAEAQHTDGMMVRQAMIGGYMYLRALMGPEDLLYALHDQAGLIHAMMGRWAELMNAALERIQPSVELDELAIADDICYNHGPLISPDMFKEFLLPYYQEVVGKARSRQTRHIYLFVDSDGWVGPVIPLYRAVGMEVMVPFEVASGCDVVEIGRQYPDLVMSGGIDKRVLAAGKQAIDKHLEYVIPAMVKRGGYIPTCDHGVPDNVSFESYLHYRKRICELDH